MSTTPSTMSREIADYKALFAERFAEVEELLTDLPAEALLWKPFDQSPWKGPCGSIGWLTAHAVSSTVYLLRRAEYAVGRREWADVDGDEGRDEFGPANHDPAYLLARVQRVHAYVNDFLDALQPGDLDAMRAHPARPREFSARRDLIHALDHLAQHLGHAQLTRQLWALHSAG